MLCGGVAKRNPPSPRPRRSPWFGRQETREQTPFLLRRYLRSYRNILSSEGLFVREERREANTPSLMVRRPREQRIEIVHFRSCCVSVFATNGDHFRPARCLPTPPWPAYRMRQIDPRDRACGVFRGSSFYHNIALFFSRAPRLTNTTSRLLLVVGDSNLVFLQLLFVPCLLEVTYIATCCSLCRVCCCCATFHFCSSVFLFRRTHVLAPFYHRMLSLLPSPQVLSQVDSLSLGDSKNESSRERSQSVDVRFDLGGGGRSRKESHTMCRRVD